MWECRKCSKPVYFAERKQSLGFDWHPNCLRCEECGKRLNPGQHAEHKGTPFCHHPCYGALFGPQLFGHGTRNECHTSFGRVASRDGHIKRSHLETQLKIYNNFYEGKYGELKSREVNGRLVLEGALRVYWGVKNPIHLKEEDDSRMMAVRRRSSSARHSTPAYANYSDSDDSGPLWRDDDVVPSNSNQSGRCDGTNAHLPPTSSIPVENNNGCSVWSNANTFSQTSSQRQSPPKMTNGYGNHSPPLSDNNNSRRHPINHDSISQYSKSYNNENSSLETAGASVLCNQNSSLPSNSSTRVDENQLIDGDPLLNQQRQDKETYDRGTQNGELSNHTNSIESYSMHSNNNEVATLDNGEQSQKIVDQRNGGRNRSVAIRRRPGRRMEKSKLKRRCSINGHFYLRETSSFVPPYGSSCSIWVSSKTSTEEVLNSLLEKYKVEMSASNFALFVVKDTGELRRIKEDESPLVTRVMLGPCEDVARIFVMDAQNTKEVSQEAAQFLNLSLAECRSILVQYEQEELRNVDAIRKKYKLLEATIQKRLNENIIEINVP